MFLCRSVNVVGETEVEISGDTEELEGRIWSWDIQLQIFCGIASLNAGLCGEPGPSCPH